MPREAEILFVAPDEKLADVARRLLSTDATTEERIEVIVSAYDDAVARVQALSPLLPRVLISRGGTAALLSRSFPDRTVIDLKITAADILTSLQRIVRHEKDVVAVVGFSNFIAGTEGLDSVLPELCGTRLRTVAVRDAGDFAPRLEELRREGVRTVLGGALTVKIAPRFGMTGVLLESGEGSVREAIREARQVRRSIRLEEARARRLELLLDYSTDGIMEVDAEGRLCHVNRAARQLLGLQDDRDVEGLPVTTVFPASLLPEVFRDRQPRRSQIRRVGDARFLVSAGAVVVDDRVVGGIETIQSADRIKSWEVRIRQDLHLKGHVAKYRLEQIAGTSPALVRVINLARRYAQTADTVLLRGETGTGKELLAQGIHLASPRRQEPFVAVNCAALPETLLESELFGYVPGAFSGAHRDGKMGLFEQAHGGTIFLDEIGRVSLSLQSRLLRVLQEKEITRVGGDSVVPVDVRVIAATNEDLGRLVEEGRFLADLYYRLHVLPLEVPTLRERKEDIPLLVELLLERECEARGRARPRCAAAVLDVFRQHDWPGNVRELENVIKRLAVLVEGPEVSPDEARYAIHGTVRGTTGLDPLHSTRFGELDRLEEEAIQRVLREVGGNRRLAARRLGISTTTLWRRLKSRGES